MSQGVEFSRLMLGMRSIQMETTAKTKPVQTPVEVRAPNFSEMLPQTMDKINETQQASAAMVNAFKVGQSGVDLTDVMIVSQKASVSFQAMIQMRNRLVQAYQDIMQMSVRAARG